ncbi:MAG: hypothetical protein ACMUIG_09215 [Thermoplasmatota archaeon]
MTDITRPVAVLSIILIISAGAASYLLLDDEPAEELWNGDLSGLETELRTRTLSFMSANSDLDPDDLSDRIQAEIPQWVSISRFIVSGYSVNVVSREVRIERIDLNADIPTPGPGLENANLRVSTNSLLYGDSGSIPIVPALRAVIDITVNLVPLSEGERIERDLSISADILDPARMFDVLFEIMDEDTTGWGSGLARDVEYMLNALARMRTANRIGHANSQTDLNVINPGDIELALNIAIAIRLVRWTGDIPDDLADNIDLYFSSQRSMVSMNPTGFRPWSESEKENFQRYEARSGYSYRKTIIGLLNFALDVGHVDTADIFASYLYMDKSPVEVKEKVKIDPDDFSTPLWEFDMISMRENIHTKDPYSLAVHTSLPGRDSLGVTPAGSLLEQEMIGITPELDVEEGYLVLGRDFLVDNMGSVRAWYTDANPERSRESMTNYSQVSQNTSVQQGRGTRCGGVPFPKALEERWFRLQWDLRLRGDFTLTSDLGGFGGSTESEKSAKREIEFDFPVRIYTWFDTRPLNDNIIFFNLNKGEPFAEANKSGFVVTPEANATEVFERDIAEDFWDAQAELSSLLRSIQWDVPKIWSDKSSLWRSYQNMAMYTLSNLEIWREQYIGIWDLLGFWEGNLSEGALIPLLDPVHIDGFVVKFYFSTISDRLDITYQAPEGRTVIAVHGLIKGPIYFTFRVISDSIRIDLDINDHTFLISDATGESGMVLGSERPNQPPRQILDLVMEPDWLIRSGGTIINGDNVPNPHFSSVADSSSKANFSLSFTFAGSGDADDILAAARSSSDPASFVTDRDIVSAVSRTGGVVFGSGFDGWFGITFTRKGKADVIPLERTLWIKPGSSSSWSYFISSVYPAAMLSTMAGSGCTDLDQSIFQDGLSDIDFVLTERSPAWSVTYRNEDARDFLVVSHLNNRADPGYGGTFCFYIEDNSGYPADNSGWGVVEAPDPVPLW